MRKKNLDYKACLDKSLRRRGAINTNKLITQESLPNNEEVLNNLTILEREYIGYLKIKSKLEAIYQATQDWLDVLDEGVYEDDPDSQEAFIDILEEFYSVKITTNKELERIINHPEHFTFNTLFINAMDSRYTRALQYAIECGAKYKDLLLIKPIDFNLPEAWVTCRVRDQCWAILRAIDVSFRITGGSLTHAELSAIANQMEVPASLLIAAKICIN